MNFLLKNLINDRRADLFQKSVAPSSNTKVDLTETWIILGAIAIVTVILFAWVAYSRTSKKNRSQVRPYSLSTEKRSSSSDKPRTKIRRRDHRPRNPTLAETGGLPPLKDDSKP